eukprot:snap_masked-scaffold_25-processed-gene-4.48-mRNA-1 protein AED:1.00 eAED:1.00 QI:0/-1/0/0/-1/1/1/0/1631
MDLKLLSFRIANLERKINEENSCIINLEESKGHKRNLSPLSSRKVNLSHFEEKLLIEDKLFLHNYVKTENLELCTFTIQSWYRKQKRKAKFRKYLRGKKKKIKEILQKNFTGLKQITFRNCSLRKKYFKAWLKYLRHEFATFQLGLWMIKYCTSVVHELEDSQYLFNSRLLNQMYKREHQTKHRVSCVRSKVDLLQKLRKVLHDRNSSLPRHQVIRKIKRRSLLKVGFKAFFQNHLKSRCMSRRVRNSMSHLPAAQGFPFQFKRSCFTAWYSFKIFERLRISGRMKLIKEKKFVQTLRFKESEKILLQLLSNHKMEKLVQNLGTENTLHRFFLKWRNMVLYVQEQKKKWNMSSSIFTGNILWKHLSRWRKYSRERNKRFKVKRKYWTALRCHVQDELDHKDSRLYVSSLVQIAKLNDLSLILNEVSEQEEKKTYLPFLKFTDHSLRLVCMKSLLQWRSLSLFSVIGKYDLERVALYCFEGWRIYNRRRQKFYSFLLTQQYSILRSWFHIWRKTISERYVILNTKNLSLEENRIISQFLSAANPAEPPDIITCDEEYLEEIFQSILLGDIVTFYEKSVVEDKYLEKKKLMALFEPGTILSCGTNLTLANTIFGQINFTYFPFILLCLNLNATKLGGFNRWENLIEKCSSPVVKSLVLEAGKQLPTIRLILEIKRNRLARYTHCSSNYVSRMLWNISVQLKTGIKSLDEEKASETEYDLIIGCSFSSDKYFSSNEKQHLAFLANDNRAKLNEVKEQFLYAKHNKKLFSLRVFNSLARWNIYHIIKELSRQLSYTWNNEDFLDKSYLLPKLEKVLNQLHAFNLGINTKFFYTLLKTVWLQSKRKLNLITRSAKIKSKGYQKHNQHIFLEICRIIEYKEAHKNIILMPMIRLLSKPFTPGETTLREENDNFYLLNRYNVTFEADCCSPFISHYSLLEATSIAYRRTKQFFSDIEAVTNELENLRDELKLGNYKDHIYRTLVSIFKDHFYYLSPSDAQDMSLHRLAVILAKETEALSKGIQEASEVNRLQRAFMDKQEGRLKRRLRSLARKLKDYESALSTKTTFLRGELTLLKRIQRHEQKILSQEERAMSKTEDVAIENIKQTNFELPQTGANAQEYMSSLRDEKCSLVSDLQMVDLKYSHSFQREIEAFFLLMKDIAEIKAVKKVLEEKHHVQLAHFEKLKLLQIELKKFAELYDSFLQGLKNIDILSSTADAVPESVFSDEVQKAAQMKDAVLPIESKLSLSSRTCPSSSSKKPHVDLHGSTNTQRVSTVPDRNKKMMEGVRKSFRKNLLGEVSLSSWGYLDSSKQDGKDAPSSAFVDVEQISTRKNEKNILQRIADRKFTRRGKNGVETQLRREREIRKSLLRKSLLSNELEDILRQSAHKNMEARVKAGEENLFNGMLKQILKCSADDEKHSISHVQQDENVSLNTSKEILPDVCPEAIVDFSVTSRSKISVNSTSTNESYYEIVDSSTKVAPQGVIISSSKKNLQGRMSQDRQNLKMAEMIKVPSECERSIEDSPPLSIRDTIKKGKMQLKNHTALVDGGLQIDFGMYLVNIDGEGKIKQQIYKNEVVGKSVKLTAEVTVNNPKPAKLLLKLPSEVCEETRQFFHSWLLTQSSPTRKDLVSKKCEYNSP